MLVAAGSREEACHARWAQRQAEETAGTGRVRGRQLYPVAAGPAAQPAAAVGTQQRWPRLRGDAAPGPPPGALAYPAFCLAAASGDHPSANPSPTPTPDPEPGAPPSTPVQDGPGRWLLGIPWPEADPGTLFEAGDQWTRLGNGIGDVMAPANNVAASIAGNNEGKAVDAFESYWASYGGRGGELVTLADACHSVATACYRYAETVIAAKHEIEEARRRSWREGAG